MMLSEKEKERRRLAYHRLKQDPVWLAKKRALHRASKKRNRARNREKTQAQHYDWKLRNKYGVSQEWYVSTLAAQHNGCAICGSREPGKNRQRFLVDHDHATGAARGLLCLTCNTGIGNLKDSPKLLRLAAAYLERYIAAQSATA